MRDPIVTSRIMASVRSKNTQPEMLLRRELHRRGLRYRLHASDLPGHPDIIFRSVQLAVFVDGDFWHGYGWQARGFSNFEDQFLNYANPEKWQAKITRNVARDKEVRYALTQMGWAVVRILESNIRSDVRSSADTVQEQLALRVRHTAGSRRPAPAPRPTGRCSAAANLGRRQC